MPHLKRIERVVEMFREGSTVEEICERFCLQTSTIKRYLRNAGLTRRRSNGSSSRKLQRERTARKAVEMAELREQGLSLEEIGVRYGVSRQYVWTLFRDYSCVSKKSNPYYSMTSEEMFEADLKLKREAYFYGLSAGLYSSLRQMLSPAVFARYRYLSSAAENNRSRGALKHFTGMLNLEISVAEFWELCLESALIRFPDLPEDEGVMLFLKPKSGYHLCRIDHTKSGTKDNLQFLTRLEFGRRFGYQYGKGAQKKN